MSSRSSYLSCKCGSRANSYYTAFRAYQGDILPKASSATGFALINGLGSLGGVIGPTLAGWLRDVTGSYVIPLIALGGVLLVGSVILCCLHCAETISRQPKRDAKDAESGIDEQQQQQHISSAHEPLLSDSPKS